MSTSPTNVPLTPAKPARIVSLDQFRGYTVAGMFLVNFLGGFDHCPEVLKHSHHYLSYADTIMPQFLFAVGFAFRLTFGRRSKKAGLGAAYRRVVTRFVGLMLVAVVVYGAGRDAANWDELKHMGLWSLYSPMKREWFQTLMHIALTAVWITPVIRASIGVRIGYMIFSSVLHIFLSHWFNFEWCSTSPNVIDGGPIGILTWSVPALLGTLVCDAVAGAEGRPNLVKMFAWGVVITAFGWAMTCGTRLYDLNESQMADLRQRVKEQGEKRAELNKQVEPLAKQRGELRKKIEHITEQLEGRLWVDRVEDETKRQELIAERNKLTEEDHKLRAEIEKITAPTREFRGPFRDLKLAEDPVFPSQERIDALKARFNEQGWKAIVAEPPFVYPPHDKPGPGGRSRMMREWNYWMVSQRQGTLSYTVISGGISIIVYVLFYIFCDILGWQLGLFRTFGTNALIAYILHGMVGGSVKTFMPRDVPAWYMWLGFLVFMWITWLFVRTLEKNNIYVKL